MGLDMYLIKRKKTNKAEDLWDFKDELIYWRKANMVHKYFCDNCVELESQVIYKVSKINLQDLLDKCNQIMKVVRLEEGKIKNGQQLTEKGWEDILEDGKYIVNEDEIADILPTTSGFFFGSTEYDEYYLKDIEHTKEELEKIIDNIDFDNEDVYYLASW